MIKRKILETVTRKKRRKMVQLIMIVVVTIKLTMLLITVIMLVLQTLMPKKGLTYLEFIPRVMQQGEEEVTLGQFILDPALAVSGVMVKSTEANIFECKFLLLGIIVCCERE